MPEKIFIFVGEPSGDLHGQSLMQALLKLNPNLHIEGVGGPRMREENLSMILPMEDFEVMGFSDVFVQLPKLWKSFRFLEKYLLKSNIESLIFIDYPGFSLRLAKSLKKKGFKGKIIQYISPSVWAHSKERISIMAECLDLLLTIYPFEKDYFKETSLPVKYIGNPILEKIKLHPYVEKWKSIIGISETHPLIALFPGSRKGEIQRNLPLQLKAAYKLKKRYPDAVFAISCAHDEVIPVMKDLLDKSLLKLYGNTFLIPKVLTYELMKDSDLAIAKSGTVTLELALHSCPTVVMYKLSWLNWLIAKYFYKVNLPYYCIVNILSEGKVFPELIKKGFSEEDLFREANALLENEQERTTLQRGCQALPGLLETWNPSEQAAKAILLT